MIAGIDGDILRYELGAISTSREQVFDVFVERPWPDEDVYKLVDQRIETILDKVGAQAYEIYLTGPGNYRDALATIRPYKGQRAGLQKPYHWETVSRRIKDHWGAVTFNGIEADDWLGVRGTEEGDNYTACSRDKDIRQILDCYHYSWSCGEHQPEIGPFIAEGLGEIQTTFKMYGKDKKTKSWRLEGHGQKFFWGQVLVGDTVDNIAGCKGVGPGSIDHIFAGCETDEDYFKACVMEYHKAYGDDWEAYLVENARLLYLIRDRSWLEIDWKGNEVDCKPKQYWEIPYDTRDYFF